MSNDSLAGVTRGGSTALEGTLRIGDWRMNLWTSSEGGWCGLSVVGKHTPGSWDGESSTGK